MKILVSACLLGENCKYNGTNNYNKNIIEFVKGHEVIAVCPEVLGGLNIPRKPAEIVDGIVMTKDGISVDKEFRKGAVLALKKAIDRQTWLFCSQEAPVVGLIKYMTELLAVNLLMVKAYLLKC